MDIQSWIIKQRHLIDAILEKFVPVHLGLVAIFVKWAEFVKLTEKIARIWFEKIYKTIQA